MQQICFTCSSKIAQWDYLFLPVEREAEMEAKRLVDERWDPLAERPTTETQYKPATIGARLRRARSPIAGALPDPVTLHAICQLSLSLEP